MTSQNPICFSDTESEPEEATFEGSGIPVSRSASVRPKTPSSSEESSVAPTIREIPPVTTHEVGESSRRPRLRRTLRKTVGRLPTRPLAPRAEPSASTTDIPCDVERVRLPGPEPLEWMTQILRRWREAEDLPSSFAAHAPITGEPIELTVPTLVGVCRTIFQILLIRRGEIRELESDTSALEGDMATVYGRLDIARTRIRALETRVRIFGFVIGAAACWFLRRTVLGTFFPYFR